MLGRRLLETIAMLMIGDSVLALISPRRHLGLWLDGPRWWHRTFEPLAERPGTMRLLGVVGLVLGVALAWREEPPAETSRSGNGGWIRHLSESMR